MFRSTMSTQSPLIDTVVVARNASATLGALLATLPRKQLRSVVVVDCASTDDTSQIARDDGALLLREPTGRFGLACMRAQQHFAQLPVSPDIVTFIPSHCPQAGPQLPLLLAPLLVGGAEMALAVPAGRGRRGMRVVAMAKMMDALYGQSLHQVSEVRAIRFAAWVALGMSDETDSYNVEMVVRGLKLGLSCVQVEMAGIGQPQRLGARNLFHLIRHATIR
jgi:glycosyltransferase involved in cell wall biosynthesis